MVDLNLTQAAIRAGYSPKTANITAYQNILKPHISKRIQQLLSKRANKVELTAERILLELTRIAFSNIDDFLGDGNEIVDLSTLPREKLAAVESVQITQDKDGIKNVKFKLYDKLKALNDAMRHLGLFEQDNRQQTMNLAILIQMAYDSRERRKSVDTEETGQADR